MEQRSRGDLLCIHMSRAARPEHVRPRWFQLGESQNSALSPRDFGTRHICLCDSIRIGEDEFATASELPFVLWYLRSSACAWE